MYFKRQSKNWYFKTQRRARRKQFLNEKSDNVAPWICQSKLLRQNLLARVAKATCDFSLRVKKQPAGNLCLPSPFFPVFFYTANRWLTARQNRCSYFSTSDDHSRFKRASAEQDKKHYHSTSGHCREEEGK